MIANQPETCCHQAHGRESIPHEDKQSRLWSHGTFSTCPQAAEMMGSKAGKGPQQRAGREAGSMVRAQKGGAQLGGKRPEKEVDRECPVTAPNSLRRGQAAGEKPEKGVEQGKGASPPRHSPWDEADVKPDRAELDGRPSRWTPARP